MPIGVIAQPYVFQHLFIDEQNLPVAATGVTISVYRFNASGAEVVIVDSVPMTSVSGDTGRFLYVLLDTSALNPGDVIYGLMSGTNPDTSAQMLVEVAISMVVAASSGAGSLVAHFVRGG